MNIRHYTCVHWTSHVKHERNIGFTLCVLGCIHEIMLPPSHDWESFSSRVISPSVYIPGTFYVSCDPFQMDRLCKKENCERSRLLRVTFFSAPFYLSVCVCVPVGNDAFRMTYLRAVRGECCITVKKYRSATEWSKWFFYFIPQMFSGFSLSSKCVCV